MQLVDIALQRGGVTLGGHGVTCDKHGIALGKGRIALAIGDGIDLLALDLFVFNRLHRTYQLLMGFFQLLPHLFGLRGLLLLTSPAFFQLLGAALIGRGHMHQMGMLVLIEHIRLHRQCGLQFWMCGGGVVTVQPVEVAELIAVLQQ